jgi:Rod binding domain-containing protein
MDAISAAAPRPAPSPTARRDGVAAAAQEFEAVFLAEMLRHAGLGAVREGPGAGPGQSSFTAMLADEYARSIAEQGGVGIAEQVIRQLDAEQAR